MTGLGEAINDRENGGIAFGVGKSVIKSMEIWDQGL